MSGEFSHVIARGSKSFALASQFLPGYARRDAHVVYAWCRHVDDAIDRQPNPLLTVAALKACLQRTVDSSDTVFEKEIWDAFFEVLERRRIPLHYPMALLDGMESDARGDVFTSMQDLDRYCYRVAGVVGLMMCHVTGIFGESALFRAAHLGMAMQITNICRDVEEDWSMQRLYIPTSLLPSAEILALKEKLQKRAPLPASAKPWFAQAVETLLIRADEFYASGRQGLSQLPWQSAWAVGSAAFIYQNIGKKIDEQDFNVLAGRAVTSTREKINSLWRALSTTATSVPARAVSSVTNWRHQQSKFTIPTSTLQFRDGVGLTLVQAT